MTGKRSKRVNSALVSVGMVALVAGCGGGSAVSNSNGSTTYIPPNKQMATATLSLLVPGRRPSAGTRSPRYVSPYTSRVDVAAVSAGAPSPWPIATSTSIPTPGPVPSGATPSPIPVTMQVPVAVGNAQFSVNTYDSGGYLLSGLVSGPVAIAPNTANSVNLVLNAAADCVEINHAGGGAFKMTPMIAQNSTQSATFTVTPCDADGYPIPSGQTLSNAITFATPAPATIIVNSNARSPRAALPTPTPGPSTLTFSPNVITAGGDTLVTVTYPARSASVMMAQAVPMPMPSSNAGLGTITADPVYLTVVSNNDTKNELSVFAHDMQGTLAFQSMGFLDPGIAGLYPSAIAAGGPADSNCASAGQALVAGQGYLLSLTEPSPTQVNPTPLPSMLPITSGFPNHGTAVALDASCNAYVGDANGYMYSVPAGLSAVTSSVGPFWTNGMGPSGAGAVTSIAWLGSPYIGLGDGSGYLNNIVSSTGADTTAGAHTVAMARYGTADLAIAYQPSNACCSSNYYLAEVVPSGGYLTTVASVQLPNTYYNAVKAITVDGNGNIWAIAASSSELFEYTPSTSALAIYNLPGGNYNPSAMTAAPDGTLYITDTGVPGNVYLYSWQNITGGLGSTAQLLGSAPVGTNPSGVTILP